MQRQGCAGHYRDPCFSGFLHHCGSALLLDLGQAPRRVGDGDDAFAEVRLGQVGPMQGRAAQTRPAQVCARQDRVGKIRPLQVTAEENRVAVTAESKGKHSNGKEYNNHYHFLFTIENGKVIKVKEYLDTEHASWIDAK